MRHQVRVSATVFLHHRQRQPAVVADLYGPHLARQFENRQLSAKFQWLEGGTVNVVSAYVADLNAEHGHHLAWLNATLEATQQAGLHVLAAYVTRSVSMALVGGGAGAAGGYKAGGAGGAIIVGAIGLIIGNLFQAHVPIFRAEYSPYYGWQLVPIKQPKLADLQLELA